MKQSAKRIAGAVLATLALLVLVFAVIVWSGVYSFAADVPHSAPVKAIIELARERSVEVRADDIDVPPLEERALAIKGAGNYAAMCAQCHLSPGAKPTELHRGLYPVPPRLAQHPVEPAAAFWVIKHGIKASGMPAWGESMNDADIWNLVAFLRVLPSLDPAAYTEMVARSPGHAHGGGSGHGDAGGTHGAGHQEAAGKDGDAAGHGSHDHGH